MAGTLRLDLASYRELEAFAQFGSDLDEQTQSKLERGKRTVELLKQGLNQPLAVEKQVVSLFSLTRGLLDDVPVKDIMRFEGELLSYIGNKHQALFDTIVETKGLPNEDDLKAAIKEFKATFIASEA